PPKLSRVAPDSHPISQPFVPLDCWCGVSLFANGGRTSPDWLAPSGEGSRVAQWNSRGRRLAPSDWSAGVFLPNQVDLWKKQIGNALERMFEVTADTQTPLPWDV
ncbi:hypothetical protein PpBr36_01001, partial [Pyricularia pennisetigena]|uniref:hypothetical protein n=1 Tax=Pyricularia pennisetigena TaxID=1578925 RepID=UPI00114EB7AE